MKFYEPRLKPKPEIPQKAKDLARQYTFERCEELLRMDPEGLFRLYELCQGRQLTTRGNTRRARRPKAA